MTCAVLRADKRVPSRPMVCAMSQGSGSDTEFLTDIVPQPTSKRLALVSSGEVAAVQGAQREGDVCFPRAKRVGAVPAGFPLPRQLRNQKWSPLNVPMMWAAAGVQDSNPVCEWLVTACGDIQEPVDFHGGIISASVAARTGLQVLRNFFRECGIMSEGDLTLWFRTNGFIVAQVGNHISARDEEHILSEASARDARAVGVSLRGAHIASRTPDGSDPTFGGSIGEHPKASSPRPAEPTRRQIDLEDVFSQRIPTLSLAHISSMVASGSVSPLRCVNGIGPKKLGTCWPKRARGSCLD